MSARHLIEQLDFRIEYDAAVTDTLDDSQLAALLQETLLPVVDDVLAARDTPGTVLTLPQLAIDLGAIERHQLREQAPARLRALLEDALDDALAGAPARAPATAEEGDHGAKGRRSALDDDIAQLCDFLARGRLAWHADLAQPGLHAALLARVLAAGVPGETALLRALETTLAQPVALRRLAEQFAPARLQALLDRVSRDGGAGADAAPAWAAALAGRLSPARMDAADALIDFLRSGRFDPVAAPSADTGAAPDGQHVVRHHIALLDRVLAGPVAVLRAVLGDALAAPERMRRLVEQFESRQLVALLEALAPGQAPPLQGWLAELRAHPALRGADAARVDAAVWPQVLGAALDGELDAQAREQIAHALPWADREGSMAPADVLLRFLRNGRLDLESASDAAISGGAAPGRAAPGRAAPGEAAAGADGVPVHVALLDRVIAGPAHALRALLDGALARPASARRLVEQCEARQLAALLHVLAPARAPALLAWVGEMGAAGAAQRMGAAQADALVWPRLLGAVLSGACDAAALGRIADDLPWARAVRAVRSTAAMAATDAAHAQDVEDVEDVMDVRDVEDAKNAQKAQNAQNAESVRQLHADPVGLLAHALAQHDNLRADASAVATLRSALKAVLAQPDGGRRLVERCGGNTLAALLRTLSPGQAPALLAWLAALRESVEGMRAAQVDAVVWPQLLAAVEEDLPDTGTMAAACARIAASLPHAHAHAHRVIASGGFAEDGPVAGEGPAEAHAPQARLSDVRTEVRAHIQAEKQAEASLRARDAATADLATLALWWQRGMPEPAPAALLERVLARAQAGVGAQAFGAELTQVLATHAGRARLEDMVPAPVLPVLLRIAVAAGASTDVDVDVDGKDGSDVDAAGLDASDFDADNAYAFKSAVLKAVAANTDAGGVGAKVMAPADSMRAIPAAPAALHALMAWSRQGMPAPVPSTLIARALAEATSRRNADALRSVLRDAFATPETALRIASALPETAREALLRLIAPVAAPRLLALAAQAHARLANAARGRAQAADAADAYTRYWSRLLAASLGQAATAPTQPPAQSTNVNKAGRSAPASALALLDGFLRSGRLALPTAARDEVPAQAPADVLDAVLAAPASFPQLLFILEGALAGPHGARRLVEQFPERQLHAILRRALPGAYEDWAELVADLGWARVLAGVPDGHARPAIWRAVLGAAIQAAREGAAPPHLDAMRARALAALPELGPPSGAANGGTAALAENSASGIDLRPRARTARTAAAAAHHWRTTRPEHGATHALRRLLAEAALARMSAGPGTVAPGPVPIQARAARATAIPLRDTMWFPGSGASGPDTPAQLARLAQWVQAECVLLAQAMHEEWTAASKPHQGRAIDEERDPAIAEQAAPAYTMQSHAGAGLADARHAIARALLADANGPAVPAWNAFLASRGDELRVALRLASRHPAWRSALANGLPTRMLAALVAAADAGLAAAVHRLANQGMTDPIDATDRTDPTGTTDLTDPTDPTDPTSATGTNITSAPAASPVGVRQLWHAALVLAADPQAPADEDALCRQLLRLAAGDHPGAAGPLAPSQQYAGPIAASTAKPPLPATVATSAPAPAPAPIHQPAPPPASTSLPWRSLTGAEEGERIPVASAGIVLAAPYLPRLFAVLGLTVDGRFVDLAAAERAVLLLQFAVTGQAEAPEYQLVLHKLLCGLALDAPVPAAIDIADAERATVVSLLEALVASWSALGRTSVDGLRQTFLTRDGELALGAESWQLKVVPGPYDMLMDRLPWSFSIIKFPWMPLALHVNWH